MRSRYLLRVRRHLLCRPRYTNRGFLGMREPVAVSLQRLRRADARTQRWRSIMEEVE